jgi:hypothetical protein
MQIARESVGWMNHPFTADGDTPPRFHASIAGIAGVWVPADRNASVIRTLAADPITIQEGPSRKAGMQRFVDECQDRGNGIPGAAGKRTRKRFSLAREQGEIDRTDHARLSPEPFDFDASWQEDIQGSLAQKDSAVTHTPLEVEPNCAGRRRLKIRTESKFVQRGLELRADPSGYPASLEQAVIDRRRISAEMMRVRNHPDQRLTADPDEFLTVVGDTNGSFGADCFEQCHLTRTPVGVGGGTPFAPRLILRHAFIGLGRAARVTRPWSMNASVRRRTASPCTLTSCARPPCRAALHKDWIGHQAAEVFVDHDTVAAVKAVRRAVIDRGRRHWSSSRQDSPRVDPGFQVCARAAIRRRDQVLNGKENHHGR